MIPSTFTLTGARCVTYDDGVRGLVPEGTEHSTSSLVRNGRICRMTSSKSVSVTVFLGDDDMAQTIVRALTEGGELG